MATFFTGGRAHCRLTQHSLGTWVVGYYETSSPSTYRELLAPTKEGVLALAKVAGFGTYVDSADDTVKTL